MHSMLMSKDAEGEVAKLKRELFEAEQAILKAL